MPRSLLHFLVSFLCLQGCQKDYNELSPFGENGVNAVIEMPAGTNKVFRFDPNLGKIVPLMQGDRQKTIDFLPFPANFGFIPGTQQANFEENKKQALRIMVLGPNLKTGTVRETRLIGILHIRESGIEKDFLIAVPLHSEGAQILDFRDFLLNHDAVKQMLEEWIVYHQGLPDTQILGWDDESAALQLLLSSGINSANQ